MNKKSAFIMGMMLFSVLAFTSHVSVSNASTDSTNAVTGTVKIGFLYPATGGLGAIGQGLLDGATAAAYRVNQSSYGFKVVLVPQDTATDPATAKTSAQTLVSDGVGVIVGAAASGATLAASEVTIPNKVPIVSYASTSPSITNLNDSDYVFRVVASDAYQGVALANLSYNSGAKSVYILNLDNAYGNGVAAKFKAAYEALGGNVTGQTAYDPASSSFATEVSSVKSSGADAVVIVAYPDDANKIFSEAASQNVNMDWYGTDGIASSSVTNGTAKDYLAGKLFGTTPSTGANATNTLYTQFLGDLNATSGSYGVYGDYAYDAVLLSAAAINDAGSATNGTAIRDSLYKVADGFKGATSPNKAFNCDGEPVSQTYDYWNATNYEVATQQSAAVAFTGLGTVATKPCGLHPYVAASSPGFEFYTLFGVFAVVGVVALKKRKNRQN